MKHLLKNSTLNTNRKQGFTLVELMVVIVIVIVLSGMSVFYANEYIASQRLKEVAWQILQDLKTTKDDAVLYQQDLNVYINYNNSPVEPSNSSNLNNRSYCYETFQWGKDQVNQLDNEHYVPTDPTSEHFINKILKYNIVIDSVVSDTSSIIQFNGKKYYTICFRSGAGSSFRGEGDIITSMDNRENSNYRIINNNKLAIKLKDTSSGKIYYVVVGGTGNITISGNLSS